MYASKTPEQGASQDTLLTMERATRVEVIDENGRNYVSYFTPGVSVSIQDDGRTIKVFAKRQLSATAWLEQGRTS